MRFFISDLHFGHYNVNLYSSRPFLHEVQGTSVFLKEQLIKKCDSPQEAVSAAKRLTVELMENVLVGNWNSVVGQGDEVYVIGDFAFLKEEEIRRIISRLKGRLILIDGNHDKAKETMLKAGFSEVHESLELDIQGRKVVLSHYPYMNPSLNHLAQRRPNILRINSKITSNIVVPDDLTYEEQREFLIKNAAHPINLSLNGAKEVHNKMKQLVSRHVGSRLVNEGKILFHGHTHSVIKRFANMINFSCEARNYTPVSEEAVFEEILELEEELEGKTINESNFTNPEFEYYALHHHIEAIKTFSTVNHLRLFFKSVKVAQEQNKTFRTQEVPNNYSKRWYELNVAAQGFIPKSQLRVGAFYQGSCRNASWAQWTGEKWAYLRNKWGTVFIDHVEAIEDDQSFDVFIPWEEYAPSEEELEKIEELK